MIRQALKTFGAFAAGGVAAAGFIQYRGIMLANQEQARSPVCLIRMNGVIAASSGGGFNPPSSISAHKYGQLLERAFKVPNVKAVALLINSPGGSPTQSSLLYKHIRDLRERYPQVPVIAFVEDIAASGGYYIACAADEIVADETSLVGSIGVIRSGFGFPEALHSLGIERRVQTAGASKNKLDPFLPETPADLATINTMLSSLHGTFIDAVKGGRGSRLHPEVASQMALNIDPNAQHVEGLGLFDGSVYVGQAAKDIGLIDDFGEYRTYLRRRFKPSGILEVKTDQFREFASQLGLLGPSGLGLLDMLAWRA